MSNQIEGIPDGWELVRIGTPVVNVDWVVDSEGKPRLCDIESTFLNRVIIRKIEKPKRYRPFANAAEFAPHRDRWIRRNHEGKLGVKGCFRVSGYDDLGVFNLTKHESYDLMFDDGRQFDDGTPFGIEVTE